MTKLPQDAGKKWLARNDPLRTREGKRKAKRKRRRQVKLERREVKRRKERKRRRDERRMLARPLLKGVE